MEEKRLVGSWYKKGFINKICGTFDMKSNYFGAAIPEKLKSFENWMRGYG